MALIALGVASEQGPNPEKKPAPQAKSEPKPTTMIPGLTAQEAVKSFVLNDLECSQKAPSAVLYTCTSAANPDYLLLYEGEIVGRGRRETR